MLKVSENPVVEYFNTAGIGFADTAREKLNAFIWASVALSAVMLRPFRLM